MTLASDDHVYMSRALRLAGRGMYTTDPNPRVGCVIVADGAVVGEGWHKRAGGPHAEIHALEQAGARASGATVYVSLEPCCHHGRTPPCTDALIDAGVARVVLAMRDANEAVDGRGITRLTAAGIQVDTGLLQADARELNPGYFQRRERGRPYVRIKIASSLDGRTALADGVSQWISSEASRADVQRWRARSSAILTGVGTILADDPSLNVRANELADAQPPMRVIADSNLRTPPAAKTLSLAGPVHIFHTAERDARAALEAAGATVERVPADDGQVSLPALMDRLAALECNEVLVEAGSELNGALLRQGLADEIIVYLAPHVMGNSAQAMFTLPSLAAMDERIALRLVEQRRFGADLRLRYRPV